MDKPLSVVIRETQNQIIDLLNESKLPLDIMSFILTDITNTIKIQAEENYRNELSVYEGESNGSD